MEYFSVERPSSAAAESIGRVPAFSFADNTFQVTDGRIEECTGKEAVKQWLELMLRQQTGKLPIYPENVGINRDLLISGLPEGVIRAEVERNVRETAEYCPAVRTVSNFEFTRLKRGLEVSFAAELHTGETVEVSADVG